MTPQIGDHIRLTHTITSLNITHQTGTEGVITEIHTDGHYTARMADGCPQFPTAEEFVLLATGPDFRARHGSEDWSPAEIDAYEHLTAIHHLAA